MKKLILLVLICIGGWQLYENHRVPVITNADLKSLNEPSKIEAFNKTILDTFSETILEPFNETILKPSNKTISVNNYSCDGRQHCSQMSSCEEATFFIKNCPNTKMDGDYDGVPCERQHCN